MPKTAAKLEAVPSFLPYGRQEITEADLKAIAEALTSGWLTTGPRVGEFEKAFAAHCGAKHAVAVNSGTAALHCAMRAIGVQNCSWLTTVSGRRQAATSRLRSWW